MKDRRLCLAPREWLKPTPQGYSFSCDSCLMRFNATTVQIVHESVVTYEADAIVNAANSSLLGGGGVDGAIHRAADPKLALYNMRYLHRCKTGDAKISPSFNIKTAQHIIHTVGPVYKGHSPEEAERLLTSCYSKSLDLAKDLESIAFSGISTGIYGYPLKDATAAALKTINLWLQANPETNLKTITLCAFSEKEYEHMREVFDSYEA